MPSESIPTLIQIIVLIYISSGLFRMMVKNHRTGRTVFFAFATTCALLSDLYWLVYDILRPDTRMPFAANEIGEWAIFLSLGAALAYSVEPYGVSAGKEIAAAILFMAANILLWIAWSGEWLQDILTGISLGYFLIYLMIHMKQHSVWSPLRWRLLGIVCVFIIAGEISTFFVAEEIRIWPDHFCYGLLFATDLYLIISAVRSLRRRPESGHTDSIGLTFASYAWSLICLYMSAGIFYNTASLLSSFSFLLMFFAVRTEEAAA